MVTNIPAWQLVKSYRFREAVEAYERQLRESPDDWGNVGGLGHALMAVGEFAAAIPYLEKIDKYYRESPGRPGCQIELSICDWMIGNRETALSIIKRLVIAVRDGKVSYTDIAGGVEQGLILCYMAITLQSRPDLDLAMKYLKKLATRRRIQYWPGPAALFLLGSLTFGEAVKSATGSADLAQAKEIAEHDLMKRRHLVNILFAAGTERRMAGDEAGCRMLMSECAGLTHPQVEYIWYLANGEVSTV
ncbi:MAG TPA: tetratricopeptide repeat protein [Rhizomicrobium sp.]|jgi:tetratricopeptide (TPR) repeat protein|nr:tetratricopeptide repeat protein [Rhizomicrobium sp.]